MKVKYIPKDSDKIDTPEELMESIDYTNFIKDGDGYVWLFVDDGGSGVFVSLHEAKSVSSELADELTYPIRIIDCELVIREI